MITTTQDGQRIDSLGREEVERMKNEALLLGEHEIDVYQEIAQESEAYRTK